MTPRSLFNIILKITGILFFRNFIFLVPQVISSFLYLDESSGVKEGLWIVVVSVLQLALYGWLVFILVSKTEWIIDRFALDKGFPEERFEINIHRSTVLYLVFVLTGIVVTVDAIPGFCRNLVDYIQQKNLHYANPEIRNLMFYLAEIIIGLLLLGNAKALVNLIELKRRK